MFVQRHEVKLDLVWSRSIYENELLSARRKLGILRDPTRSDLLTPLGMSASHVYDHGLRIGADPAVCAWALGVAARANTAAFVFADEHSPPRHWRLDEGLLVTFSDPVDESSVHAGRWIDAAAQAVVARQHDCLRELMPIDYDYLRRSSTRSSAPKRDYHYVEMHRALARTALDPERPLAVDYKTHAAGSRPAKSRAVNRRIGKAIDRTAEALDARDATAFNAALAESLELRRVAFGGLDEASKQNHTVLWPLLIIALAALAHDRGMAVEVESDYLPAGWVQGDVFRRLTTAVARLPTPPVP